MTPLRQPSFFPGRHQRRSRPRRGLGDGGFALLITVTLVAFLVLITVGLATLTRVETQVAANSQTQDQARQNALMALNIALGQLQKHTGPDQRVTATADLSAASTGERLAPGAAASNSASVNGTPNGLLPSGAAASVQTGTRWWTGVWGRSGPSYATPGLSPYVATPSPVLLNWLVSGNEDRAFTTDADGLVSTSTADGRQADNTAPFNPGAPVNWTAAGLDLANPGDWAAGPAYADLEIKTSGQKAVLLVGPGSAGEQPAANGEAAAERYVVAPVMDISVPSANVPGAGSSGSTTIGRYAWWVGDEGTKASYALADSRAGKNTPGGSDADAAESRLRLMAASRSGVELVPGFSAYPPTNDVNSRVRLERLLQMSQAPVLDASLADETWRARFNDFTIGSRGILSDTLQGGLRKDLTHYFEMSPGDWSASELAGENIIPSTWSPNWGTSAAPDYAPKWDWIYSFYNTNPSVAGATLPIRPETGTQAGVIPIITQFRMILFTDPDLLGTERRVNNIVAGTYSLPVRCNVVFVLANPYNFTLTAAADTHEFSIRNTRQNDNDETRRPPSLSINVAESTNTLPLDTAFLIANPAGETAPSLLDSVRFVLPAFAIPPGESRVFSVRGNNQVAGGGPPPATSGTEDIVELEMNDSSNPVTSADGDPVDRRFFTAKNNIEFTATRTRTRMFLHFNNSAFFTTTLRQTGSAGGAIVQQLSDCSFSKQNAPLGGDENEVLGMMHVKFMPPGRRDMDASNAAHGGSVYALYTHARAFQDLNLRAGNIDLPAVSDTGRARTPTSYAGGYARSGYQPIPGSFSQDLVPTAAWAEDFSLESRSPIASKGVFFDFPRRTAEQPPVLSIAQLQHASLTTDDWHPDSTVHYQAAYAVGNSYYAPFVTRGVAVQSNRAKRFHGAPASATRYFDMAYLLNTALWDGYFFSGIPQTGAGDFSPRNARYEIHGDPDADDVRDKNAAAHLLVKGAFNINSTSHAAWVALLGGLNSLRVNDDSVAQGVPFPRTLWQPENNTLTGSSYQNPGTGDDAYAGYRRLNAAELDALAAEIVKRVRARGPFVSLSHFINRSLVAASADFNPVVNDADLGGNLAAADAPMGRGLAGPLQAAIDADASGINTFQEVGGDLVTANGIGAYGDRLLFGGEVLNAGQKPPYANNMADYYADKVVDIPNLNPIYDEEARPGPQGRTSTGLPGWLLQGDILQAIGPALPARSDTFVIRTYGEVVNPADPTQRLAQAWCEAVVQRQPDYIDPVADTPDEAPATLTPLNLAYGRGYKIVSFRWLSPKDI
ncbi:MAG: hypothetical protein ABII82_20040 [Verrucomicrobiota bacterium]